MPSPWTLSQDAHSDWKLTLSGTKTILSLQTPSLFSTHQPTKHHLFFYHVSLSKIDYCVVILFLKSFYHNFHFRSTVMYPKLFSMFGYFTERLIVTEEMKFFFKLLENVLKERSQSNEVRTFDWNVTIESSLSYNGFVINLTILEIQRLYWSCWWSNFRIHEGSRWKNGAHVVTRDYRWDPNGTGKYWKRFLFEIFLNL